MPTKLLWLSRHNPTKVQVEDLKKSFGDVEIEVVFEKVERGKRVVELVNDNSCDEAVVVLPENLLQEVVDAGFYPLRAIMTRSYDEEGRVRFNHSHFERVMKVDITTEKLQPKGVDTN